MSKTRGFWRQQRQSKTPHESVVEEKSANSGDKGNARKATNAHSSMKRDQYRCLRKEKANEAKEKAKAMENGQAGHPERVVENGAKAKEKEKEKAKKAKAHR